MEFEFAHLLHPLHVAPPAEAVPALGTGLAPEGEHRPPAPCALARTDGPADWIATLRTEPAAGPTGWAPPAASQEPARGAPRAPGPDLGPDLGIELAAASCEPDEAVAGPAAPPRSRFADPSLDDDLLPRRRKRR